MTGCGAGCGGPFRAFGGGCSSGGHDDVAMFYSVLTEDEISSHGNFWWPLWSAFYYECSELRDLCHTCPMPYLPKAHEVC